MDTFPGSTSSGAAACAAGYVAGGARIFVVDVPRIAFMTRNHHTWLIARPVELPERGVLNFLSAAAVFRESAGVGGVEAVAVQEFLACGDGFGQAGCDDTFPDAF